MNTDFLLDQMTRETRHTRDLRHVGAKTSFPLVGKMSNMYIFCRKKQNYSLISAANFRNLKRPDLLQDTGLIRG